MKTQINSMVIWTENLEVSESLKDISMIVEKGEFIGITGLTKDDKKELIRILSCFQKPKNGKYIFDYENMSQIESGRLGAVRRSKIGHVFDDPKLIADLNVIQNVAFWMDCICPGNTAYAIGENILKELGMGDKRQYSIDKLSNLEKAMVSLARAVINTPLLLLMDDIFSLLKPEEQEQMIKALLILNEKGTTIIAFTDSQKVLSSIKRVIVF